MVRVRKYDRKTPFSVELDSPAEYGMGCDWRMWGRGGGRDAKKVEWYIQRSRGEFLS
jgi:hypothetical protein